MNRRIEVVVDAASWPSSHPVPQGLLSLQGTRTVDMYAVLLHTVKRTSPPIYADFTLPPWACLRYLPALDSSPDLRLRSEWNDLDPHQKTILSDDFGVGFSSYFLEQSLGLCNIMPVLYALQHPSYFQLPNAVRSYRRGRTPDYIALDSQSRIHIFECKGTQKSPGQLDNQLKDGKKQVQTLDSVFNSLGVSCSRRGESLAAGIFVPKYNSRHNAVFKVVDPSFVLDGFWCDPDVLVGATFMSELASSLHLLGAHHAGNSIAAGRDLSRQGLQPGDELERLRVWKISGEKYLSTEFKFSYRRTSFESFQKTVRLRVGMRSSLLSPLMKHRFQGNLAIELPKLLARAGIIEGGHIKKWETHSESQRTWIETSLGLRLEMEVSD